MARWTLKQVQGDGGFYAEVRSVWSLALVGMALLAAGCDSTKQPNPQRPDPRHDSIACWPAGSDAQGALCPVERSKSDDGLILTIRHPDGSFRRLLVAKDGRGVIAADGAEQPVVKIADTIGKGAEIEVTLGGDRYLLPAKIKGAPAAKP